MNITISSEKSYKYWEAVKSTVADTSISKKNFIIDHKILSFFSLQQQAHFVFQKNVSLIPKSNNHTLTNKNGVHENSG